MINQKIINATLHLADTTLILAQKNSEWCAHGPILEQDIAITNITLDLIGQSRMFYQYAAELINELENKTETEDTLSYLRSEREFKNFLIAELPNGDWAQTILRQFFFSSFQQLLFEKLQHIEDKQISAIAVKSLKEINYHVKWSSEWVIRLGDGTSESHSRMVKAIEILWPYTGEFFNAEENDLTEVEKIKSNWIQKIEAVFIEANLLIPQNIFMQLGGKQGFHTEHLGYILTEMQSLQRAYPGLEW